MFYTFSLPTNNYDQMWMSVLNRVVLMVTTVILTHDVLTPLVRTFANVYLAIEDKISSTA